MAYSQDKKNYAEIILEEAQRLNILDRLQINCLQYAQGVKETHGQTTKGNQENDVSTHRKYQQRNKHK